MAVETMDLCPSNTTAVDTSTVLASQTSILLDSLFGFSSAFTPQIAILFDPLLGTPVIINEPVTQKMPAKIPQHCQDHHPHFLKVVLPGLSCSSMQSDLPPLLSHPIRPDTMTTPRQPLQVPESLQSIINYASTEQLSWNSNQIVDSIHGVLDECILHLEAFIDVKIASVGSKQIVRGSHGTQGLHTQVDSEGDC